MNISPNLVVLLVALCCLVVITEAKRKFRFDDDDCDTPTPTPPSSAIRLAEKLDNCPANAFTIVLMSELTHMGNRFERVYSSKVLIGGQNKDLRFDTTARATWLPANEYCKDGGTNCKLIQKGSELQLSGGKVKGDVYEDTIKFCGDLFHWRECESDKVKVELAQHRLLAALNVRHTQKGSIGLSSEQSNDLGGATLLQALKQQGISTRFGLYLSPTLTDQRNRGGDLVIGCVNENRFNKGTERYHSLVGGGRDGWKVKLNGVKVGDSLIPNSDTLAILDTGRERIRAPRAAFEEIRKLLQADRSGSGTRKVDCRSWIKITFTIDSHVYSIDRKSFIINPSEEQDHCQLNIDPWDKSEWSLGTSFLRNYYTIFEQDNGRVGFANPDNS